MKQSILLKQFEYSIPASSFAIAGLGKQYAIAGHLPLMKVFIDFEKGKLYLEGDWQFMIAANTHSKPGWSGYHRERVKIETAVYPAMSVNLDDHNSDGLVFPMEGIIQDGSIINSCSGLLVIDNIRSESGLISKNWNISFYIYDAQFDDCEIKFKLPLFQYNGDEVNN